MAKRIASTVILWVVVLAALRAEAGKDLGLEAVARAAGTEDLETVFSILRHLAGNAWRGISVTVPEGKGVFDAVYRLARS